SLRPENHSASAGAPLMLRLAGCGDGGALQPGKRGVAMTVSGSLVTGPGTGSALLPDRKLSGCDHLVIHDGDTFLLCRPDRRQEEMLAAWRKRATQEGEYSDARSNPAMLRLSIKYE
ncbi:protein papJ, partial [Escherichia coli]|nr:protein papJ [Escherichia coli]